MTLTITPSQLKGAVTPPPSKSQAHRFLIAAALAGEGSKVHNLADSQDIRATKRCLEEIGPWVGPMSPLRRMALPVLDCGESGSTLRSPIPAALAQGFDQGAVTRAWDLGLIPADADFSQGLTRSQGEELAAGLAELLD